MIVSVLLVAVVLLCWIGVVGMWRMREPLQALHYLSLPASLGAVLLAVAVFCHDGFNQVSMKTVLIAGVLLAFNSVVTHATARAFRIRAVCEGDTDDPDALQFSKADRIGRTS